MRGPGGEGGLEMALKESSVLTRMEKVARKGTAGIPKPMLSRPTPTCTHAPSHIPRHHFSASTF